MKRLKKEVCPVCWKNLHTIKDKSNIPIAIADKCPVNVHILVEDANKCQCQFHSQWNK
jgi:hypothetical protein